MDVAIDKNTRWPLVRLGDVCEIKSGASDTIDAVSDGKYAFFDRSKKIKRSNRFLFDAEALIIAGEGTEFTPKYYSGKFDLHQRAYALYNFSKQVNIYFVNYYFLLRSDYLPSVAVGATVKSLRMRHFADFLIPLPPLVEQQRIVARLDAAFAAIAEASAAAEANLRNARALFDSYLDQVFSTRGAGWVERRLGDVGEIYDGPHATPRTVKEGPIFLGISALHDGELDLQETRHVTVDDFKKWTRRVLPQANDFVFSYETRLGQAAVIPEGLECCLGRRMGLIRFNNELVNPYFFTYQYLSPFSKAYLLSKTIKGATVDRFSIKDFPDFIFVFPSIAIQNEIVFKIQQFNAHTAQLTAIYEQKITALTELKQALLAEVFGAA